MDTQTQFSLGNDVRLVGRWIRLILGVLILVSVAEAAASERLPLRFYGEAGLYLAGVLTLYLAAHYGLGERLLVRVNPWLSTLLLVVPLLVGLVPGLLPDPLRLALLVYIGVSLILNFAIRYGGCEVLAVPTLLFKRRYTVYCPTTVVDVVENAVVVRRPGQPG